MNEGMDAAAIIIGGGPAGLFLAARLGAMSLAHSSDEGNWPSPSGVLLLERGQRPGRKLLASGSGRCNITHKGGIEDFLDRYGGKGRFLKKALYAFPNSSLIAWFLERGLSFETEDDGKIFPASRRASDVLRALTDECLKVGAITRLDSRVISLDKLENGFEIGLEGKTNSRLRAATVAIATGGMSYPSTGSSGDGYRLAASLGHSIVEPRPALSALRVARFDLAELAGISFEDLPFVQRREGKKLAEYKGDLLITHEGLSGPGVLDASRNIASGDVLELDFGGRGAEAFRMAFQKASATSARASVKNIMTECGLPKRMSERLCAMAGLEEGATCAELRKSSREEVLRLATAYPAEVEAVGGFEKAMATAGGVSLAEVDPSTMESRIAQGLFFSGEVLDYDGDTGGYNLQAAFSTAALAAKAMGERIARGRASHRKP